MPNANPHHSRRWIILLMLSIGVLMVMLDATIVNIALPSAQKSLHFSNDNRQWIITAYSLAFGSLLLLGGKISDLFGRKWTFIAGLAGFALSSAVGGASQSFGMLAAARACQGAFGALLAPAALSLLATTFTEPSERNKAFGIYSAVAGSGASVGLLLGGFLTEYLSWRFCMYVNLVFASIAVTGALLLLHNQAPAVKPKLDVPGTILAFSGLFSLVWGFNHAETTSWGDSLTVASLIAGVALLAVFAALEWRSDHPLLPPRVLADRNRAGSFVSMLLAAAGMFGVFLFLTYYLQQTRGYSPVTTGLAFLPMTIVIMATAVVSNTRLRGRFGPRPLTVAGMALGSAGMLFLTGIGLDTSYVTGILPALLLVGVGLGTVFSGAITGSTLGVEARDTGVASATVTACQQVGGSLGTALLSTLASSAAASYVTSAHARPTHELIAQASVHGYTTAFAVSSCIFAAGAVVAGLLFERRAAIPAQAPGEPVVAH